MRSRDNQDMIQPGPTDDSVNAEHAPETSRSRTAGRVLVVDDDSAVRDLFRATLSRHGYAVDDVGSGEDAMLRLDEHDYDVVVTDLVMPGCTGVDVVRRVKRRAPDTNVVAVTGHGSTPIAEASLREGAIDLLEKPVTPDELAAVVRRAADRRRLETDVALLAASQAIFSTDEPASVPRVATEVAMDFMAADDASLMLVDSSECLKVAFSTSLSEDEASAVRVVLGKGVAGRVAQDGTPALVGDGPGHDPRFVHIPNDRDIESSIVYPLTVERTLLGVLNLNRFAGSTPFTPRDLARAGALASQIALALRNRKLVYELRSRLDALELTQSRLVQSERLVAIGQIAAGVAHEINNPVSYVMANVEFVAAELRTLQGAVNDVPPSRLADALFSWWQAVGEREGLADVVAALDEATEGSRRIRRIVADVRSLARVDADGGERFELASAIRSALRIATVEVRGRAKLDVDLQDGVEVVGSAGQISQVFINLIINAVHAMSKPQDDDNRICVACRRLDDRIEACVSDNGAGIRPEVVGRIFEPFFTTKGPDKGTGLGLAISRDTIERHGGRIYVESDVGKGTRFTIHLPLADAASAAEPECDDAAPRAEATARRLHLLLIDDEEPIRRSYERLFGRDHEITMASDGYAALELLQRGTEYDLVLSDLVMPGISGMDLFRWTVDHRPSLAERFVFVTGGLSHADVSAFAESVKNPVLEKPVPVETLRALLRDTASARGAAA
jgi:signal transduction histidine kinase/CheY-like chemotaxis protein